MKGRAIVQPKGSKRRTILFAILNSLLHTFDASRGISAYRIVSLRNAMQRRRLTVVLDTHQLLRGAGARWDALPGCLPMYDKDCGWRLNPVTQLQHGGWTASHAGLELLGGAVDWLSCYFRSFAECREPGVPVKERQYSNLRG